MIAQPVAGTLGNRGVRSHTELDGHGAYIPVQPFTKAKRAQSNTDDETWVQGQVNPTLSLFDQGDTRATTVAVTFTVDMQACKGNANVGDGSVSPTLCKPSGNDVHAVAFQQNQLGEVRCGNIAGTVNTNSNASGRNTQMAMHAMTVRRLTPRECERLQGFEDDFTLIPWRGKPADQCPDGPRYKALGNSMAVNCMEWIGERIASHEARTQVD